jgi:DNA-binding NtrC family response regulator
MTESAINLPGESAPGAMPLRILLLDDDPRILRALQALLRAHVTTTSADSANAVELAAQHDIDVVICNQHNAATSGIEVLTAFKQAQPRIARILLAGYPDRELVRAAINEAEVFRLVEIPWANACLRAFVEEAGAAARAPLIETAVLGLPEYEYVRARISVVVIEDDSDAQQRLREMLQTTYKVHIANSLERALQVMEQYETGVVICDTQVGRSDLIGPLKMLKQSQPHIGVIVVTRQIDAHATIGLINQAQVYRLLPRPVRAEILNTVVDAALMRNWRFKQNPPAARRAMATPLPAGETTAQAALFNRIRSLPGRLGATETH